MNYEQWGNVRTSPNGSRLSLYIADHIYLMDADGSNLRQVTESNATENLAEFSPDGRKLYHLDNSPEVVPVVAKNTGLVVKAAANTHWFLRKF